jgi:DNA-directed RNA polymerase subunit RPC12/RpoP
MKSKGILSLGVALTCLAFGFFIYVFEARTVLGGVPPELTLSDFFKYAGYLAALLGITFLFSSLFKIRNLIAENDKLRRQKGKSNNGLNTEVRGSIPIVSFECLNCGKNVNVEFVKSNDSIKCPYCRVRNLIPEAAIESMEEVILRSRKGKIIEVAPNTNKSDGLAISSLKLLAWINLVLLSGAGIYLIAKGTPANISDNIYYGTAIIYAGLLFTTLMFGLVWLSINQINRSQSQQKNS